MLRLYSTPSREPCPSYETILKAHPPFGSAMAHMSSHFRLPTGDTSERDITMPPFILLLLPLVLFACAFAYITFCHAFERRPAPALDTKRNQYLDRAKGRS